MDQQNRGQQDIGVHLGRRQPRKRRDEHLHLRSGGLPLEQIGASGTSWYFHDQLGNTRALTTSAGQISGPAGAAAVLAHVAVACEPGERSDASAFNTGVDAELGPGVGLTCQWPCGLAEGERGTLERVLWNMGWGRGAGF